MNKITIIFAIDNNYVKQCFTVVKSILLNSDKNRSYEIDILSKDISIENEKIIRSLANKYNNVSFNFVNMVKILENFNLEKYMSRRQNYEYISIETYFRFFIPELFKQYDKVLYLDADVIVNDDISKLFDEDINNYYAGVVQDKIIETCTGNPKSKMCQYPNMTIQEYFQNKLKKSDFKYFNAGVLLLNLSKIRNDNIVEKLWKYTADESPLEYQDQDVLNAVIGNNVKYLEYKWNVLSNKWGIEQYPQKKFRKILKKTYQKPSIFHYVGEDKPWKLIEDKDYNYNHIMLWWKYYKQTPYYNKFDKYVLKNILWHKKYHNYLSIFYLNLLGFDILKIDICNYRLNLRILHRLKTNIKLIKPKYFNSMKSI